MIDPLAHTRQASAFALLAGGAVTARGPGQFPARVARARAFSIDAAGGPFFYSGHRASVRRRSQRRIDQLNRLKSRPSFLMAPLRQHAHSVLGGQMLRVRSTSARRSMLQRTRSARPASVPSTMACHQKRRLRCRCGFNSHAHRQHRTVGTSSQCDAAGESLPLSQICNRRSRSARGCTTCRSPQLGSSLMAAAGPAATTAARDHPHRLRLAPRDLFLGR